MTLGEFRALVLRAKESHPRWFELESDPPATEGQIWQSEQRLRCSLPEHYHSFVKEFGGGYFAFSTILSVNPESEWNIVDFNAQRELIGSGFVAISDDHTGDLHGFKVRDSVCDPAVWVYDHDSDEWSKTSYNDLFEFLQRWALKD